MKRILSFQKLVSKPDQLIKRRGKLGLIKVKTDLAESKKWIGERMGKDQQVIRHKDCTTAISVAILNFLPTRSLGKMQFTQKIDFHDTLQQ